MRIGNEVRSGSYGRMELEELGVEMGVGIGTVWRWGGWNSVSGGHERPTLGQYQEGTPMGL